ncbi:MAG: DUF1294 domain-containing protein [Lachnospiraceae bacterium]|nr:DUF1294 domain-containing protein [Lachnospiraceae bacterium]
MDRLLIVYLVIINIIAFALYGIDKFKAMKNAWRIPEATLIGIAAIGGGLGAYIGMQIFRHKTRKPLFTILVPLLMILWLGGVLWYFKNI